VTGTLTVRCGQSNPETLPLNLPNGRQFERLSKADVKLSFCITCRHTADWVNLGSLLMPELHAGEGIVSCPGHFYPRESAPVIH